MTRYLRLEVVLHCVGMDYGLIPHHNVRLVIER
jgi:hypothetical protein